VIRVSGLAGTVSARSVYGLTWRESGAADVTAPKIMVRSREERILEWES
jgi:hypothetical protein